MCVSACIIYNTYPPNSNPDFTTIVMTHAKITTSCYFKKAFFVFVFSIKKKKKETNKQKVVLQPCQMSMCMLYMKMKMCEPPCTFGVVITSQVKVFMGCAG